MYKALHITTGSIVAAKLVPIDDDLDDIFKEINVIKECHSPHIVKFFGNLKKDNHLWVSSWLLEEAYIFRIILHILTFIDIY